jgi:hypothetical protein
MRSDWTLPMSSAVTGFPSRTITAIAAEAGLSAHELGALRHPTRNASNWRGSSSKMLINVTGPVSVSAVACVDGVIVCLLHIALCGTDSERPFPLHDGRELQIMTAILSGRDVWRRPRRRWRVSQTRTQLPLPVDHLIAPLITGVSIMPFSTPHMVAMVRYSPGLHQML